MGFFGERILSRFMFGFCAAEASIQQLGGAGELHLKTTGPGQQAIRTESDGSITWQLVEDANGARLNYKPGMSFQNAASVGINGTAVFDTIRHGRLTHRK